MIVHYFQETMSTVTGMVGTEEGGGRKKKMGDPHH